MSEEMKTVNEWLLTLCDGRRSALLEDKWALVQAYGDFINDQSQETITKQAEEIKSSKGQIESLFERIAGVSVSEYDEDQLDYLADYIEGELDANEECIASLKADKAKQAERIKELEKGLAQILECESPLDMYHEANQLLQGGGE